MAYAVKRNKIWYVRFKDEKNVWQYKSCGKMATRVDADYLANEYSAKEMNRHHRAPVRIIQTDLEKALVSFRDDVIPRSVIGIDKQQSSIRREKASFNNFIGFVQDRGLVHFNSFDKEMAQIYMDHRQDQGMSAKTRREERRLLRRFFKWAKKQTYCIEDPTEDLIAPKFQKKKPRFFSEEELMAIFNLAREPYRSIFKFLYYTGLRTGELCNLEWRDYNNKTRTLTIRIVAADKKKRTPGNKTKREETIPINDSADKILQERKAANESEQFIFLNHAGNRLDDDNIYRNLMPILRKLNIRDAHPHTFRHTFASHLVIAGVSIYVVKELLRHASVRETEIYAHLAKDSTRSAVNKLDEKFKIESAGSRERKLSITSIPVVPSNIIPSKFIKDRNLPKEVFAIG
jgi:Site-specific recombinase XerD